MVEGVVRALACVQLERYLQTTNCTATKITVASRIVNDAVMTEAQTLDAEQLHLVQTTGVVLVP